ncbi:MAG: polyphosphate polymerase domain-containing protein [Oscillospiraceae bacterium]|nr:polyphosphate polymerase domain-containing protein [Oscillospiraceae bacterium]
MEFRVENKYLVTDADLAVIKARLKTVMKQDVHQDGDCYTIRSLYFDDINDNCMKENDGGVDQRKKYRIRIYDPKGDFIRLEIKEKQRSVTKKYSCRITREESEMIMNGTIPLTFDSRKPLNELKLQMRCAKMMPKTIIEYERTAFVHPVGNVRITFDRNIAASRYCDSFFDERTHSLVPVLPAGVHVLEVKYDEFLPDFIAAQLETGILRQTAFSKYYLGRLAVNGELAVDR